MPSQFPSSFASAAAGNNKEETGSSGRGSIRGDGGNASGDWSRRGLNGSATFRRPSLSTTLSHHQQTNPNQSSTSGVYVPPHAYNNAGRNGGTSESRYSKDELLSIFKVQKESGELDKNLANLMVGDWTPGSTTNARNWTWSKADEDGLTSNGNGPDICWEHVGKLEPVGLDPMTAEEKDLFSGSVNSPIKPPAQNTKDSNVQSSATLGRRSSVSQGQPGSGAFGLSSPTTSRPSNRRRETSDSIPYSNNPLSSPTGTGRFFRDEPNAQTPPLSLLRRRTDTKDTFFGTSSHDAGDKDVVTRENPAELNPPFSAMLRRNATGGVGGNVPSSPWSAGPQSAGLSPMGAFGSFALGGPGQPVTPGEKKSGFGSLRGESRFSKLMNKDTSDESSLGLKEKSSVNSLGKLSEAETEHPALNRVGDDRYSRPVSSSTDPFGDDEGPSGSAALGGGQDASPICPSNAPGLGTPTRQISRNDFGFSSLGEPSGMGGLRELNIQQRLEQHHNQNSQSQHSAIGDNEPLSPTETNPYQSPVPEKADSEDIDADDLGFQNIQHPGIGGILNSQGLGGFSSLPRGLTLGGFDGASDRSQTSSTGASKGFPSLGGLSGLGGLGGNWPSSTTPGGPGVVGTPDRERSSFVTSFGASGFASLGDFNSPGPTNSGGAFGVSGASAVNTTGTVGRSRRLASLFPPAMQAQMQPAGDGGRRAEEDGIGEGADGQRAGQGMGSLGRSGMHRDTDSPMRSGRGVFDDLLPSEGNRVNMDGFDNGFFERDHNLSASSQSYNMGGSLQTTMPIPSGMPQQNTQQSRNTSQPSQQIATAQNPASGAPTGQFQQERQMVMPDRMRWVYKDTNGVMQGPFSGLEMHDWFKAGFFTPDLQVKKYEDNEYKPLGQIIRQIGNSREPFLVPQMGIPYGPPSNQENGQWGGGAAATAPNQPTQAGTVQPPFAGSFPSFGTTLTAEQQNNLERRKQEEQYLMARQREHLVQQQVIQKQVDAARMHALHGVHPVQQLHHHGSAHSLHSQPSFGSMTSPGGFQPTPPTLPVQMPHSVVPGFFDVNAPLRPVVTGGLAAIGPGPDFINGPPIRDEEVAAYMRGLSFRDPQPAPFGPVSVPLPQQHQENQIHSQQVAAILAQRAQLSREQAQHDAQQQAGASDTALQSNERLQQFHELRAQMDDEHVPHAVDRTFRQAIAPPTGHTSEQAQSYKPSHRAGLLAQDLIAKAQIPSPPATEPYPPPNETEVQTLNQQGQISSSTKQPPAIGFQQESVWSKVENTGLPQPFPPPPLSVSPLPAPTAQKSRQNLPDALTVEARSTTQTPSADTPSATASVAPWAKETIESTKGPSLKEIQEAEARKAAKAEEAAAATRRAQFQQELASQAQAPVPGLPATSTWGTAASPGVTPPASAPSAWARPLAKGSVSRSGAGIAKSLSEIQKEEELYARKQKAATASAANAANAVAAPISAGKRYADLAGKPVAQGPAQGPGGAWTTVGAGGKTKGSLVSGTVVATPQRTASSGAVPVFAPVSKLRPAVAPTRSMTLGGPLPGQPSANDEFTKWAKSALSKGLNKSINVDDFLQQLLAFPQENDLISECIYANSQTMDGRRFAEEFIRRQKLAEQGISEGTSSSSKGSVAGETRNPGGWSEVAKKGPLNAAKEAETNSTFKVVEAKKKGKK